MAHVTVRFTGGGRDRERRCVGEVQAAFGEIAIDLRMERAIHLACGGAKGDPVAASGNVMHGEPLRLEPSGEFGQVVGAGTKAIAELFRREPLAEEGRGWFSLGGEELTQE